MEKTAEQRHRELVAATILAGILTSPNMVYSALHLREQEYDLAKQAVRMAEIICGPEPRD